MFPKFFISGIVCGLFTVTHGLVLLAEGAKPVRRLQTVSAHTNTLAQAEALAAKGQWDEAISICNTLAGGNSAQTRPALLLKAQCLEYAKQPEAALACYRGLLKEYPRALDAEDIRLQTIRLSALELLQPDGIKELETFVRDNPHSKQLRQARWWLAGVAFKRREWDSGTALFAAFVKDFPNAPERDRAQECLRECEAKVAELAALDKKRAASIAAAQAEAQKATETRQTLVKLREGRADMAKERFQNVRLGLSLLLQDRKLEAEAAIREAKKARPPGPPNPWDELDRLLKVCAGDASLWPDSTKLRADAASRRDTLRADLLFALCDYAKARRIYERVAGDSKDLEISARAWLQAGRCWNQLQRFDKALDCYERFLKSPFDNSLFADAALLRAGVIYVGPLRQSRKGRVLYDRILERYPNGAYAEMAELYLCTLDYWAKDWKAALAKHETFVKRHPNSPNTGFVRRERLPVIRAALAAKK